MITTAFVFPGQGSQSVGMLAEAAAHYPEIKMTFDEASEVLGYDLWEMSQHGPAEELDKTMHTQPALLAASYAIWRVLQGKTSMQPQVLAGHSLGEYTALVCADALQYHDAIKLVAARGQYMQDAVAAGVGAMAAIIGLEDAAVEAVCQEAAQADEVLSPANFNSIGQVVVAGHKPAVERAIALAKAQGAKLAMLIPVSVPSHCALMKPASERLAALLDTMSLADPRLPVINNVEAKRYQTAADIRSGLVRQLYMPVRWVQAVQSMIADGVQTVVECGPGKVLTGLNKRIDKNLRLMATSDMAGLNALLAVES